MKRFSLILVLACVLLPAQAGAQGASPEPSVSRAGQAFFGAQELEQKDDFAGAIAAYLEVAKLYPKSPYAGEAVLRVAVVYDDRLYNPPEAIRYYRAYLDTYGGRQSRRAETRIQALDRYENADVNVYRRYRIILDLSAEDVPAAREKMEAFIRDNPECPFLDEALLWQGNEYRGFKRGITDPSERENVRRAIPYYKRIIDEFPDSASYLYALKNLADCYRLLGEYQESRRLYQEVMRQGGDFGRMLVGKQMTMAKLDIYRTRVLYAVVFLLVASLAGLFLLVEFSTRDLIPGLLAGLRKSLFFLPVAGLLVLVTWLYTDATMGNISGKEPWLVGLLCLIAMAGLVINELAIRAEARKKVPPALYLPVLAGLIFSMAYLAYYVLDLLPYAERIFLPA